VRVRRVWLPCVPTITYVLRILQVVSACVPEDNIWAEFQDRLNSVGNVYQAFTSNSVALENLEGPP
jgi:hypothetical protein